MKKRGAPRSVKRTKGPLSYRPAVGVTWYATEQEWAKVKATAEDPERFEDTYAEWVAVVENGMEQLWQAGIAPQKVPITARELLAWRRLTGKTNNGSNRALFVSEKLRKKHEADIN